MEYSEDERRYVTVVTAAMLNNSPMVCRLLLFDLKGDDPLGAELEPGFRGTGGPTAVDDLRTTRLGRRLSWNVHMGALHHSCREVRM